MNEFVIVKFKGEQTFIRTPPVYVNAVVLAANTAETTTVPASGAFVIFSADGDFYARANNVATVPSVDVTDGTASELNPSSWYVVGCTGIGLIAAATRKVTLSYYSD